MIFRIYNLLGVSGMQGLWDVNVHVYKNREKYGYGVAVVTNRKGKEVYRFQVRAEGTAGHNREKENADTPLGTYNIPNNWAWLTSNSNDKRTSYGPNPRLVMQGESGEIINAERKHIRIHGGRQEIYNEETGKWETVENPKLEETYGCLRAIDQHMKRFKEITDKLEKNDSKESPGKVFITDDLQKTNKVSQEGTSINLDIEYNVPDNEKGYWENYIIDLFNN